MERVSQTVEISEGTIYPLLKRLQKERLLSSYIMESSEGPARKYYRLTDLGKTKFVSLKEDWKDFVAKVNSLINEVSYNDRT